MNHILQYIFPSLIWLFSLSISLRILTKKQSISVTLSWILIIYLIPIVGILAYLLLGEIRLGKQRAQQIRYLAPKYNNWLSQLYKHPNLVETKQSLYYKSLFQLCSQRLNIPCIVGNELHILSTPEQIFRSLIDDIQQAKESINMVFYIWQQGGLINEVEEALLIAVHRGVKINILLDSVGSRTFFHSASYQRLNNAGINIKEAIHVNIFRFFIQRLDLRQHRKIVVIDNQIAYTGSMNMVDPNYFKQTANVGQWIDLMVRINGPVSAILNVLHSWDWEIESNTALPLNIPNTTYLPLEKDNSHAVQVLATGPGFPEDLMSQSLLTAIFAARRSISITTPYFVPSQTILEALHIAALRGVKIDIILPQKSDSVMVHWASRMLFEELLKAGIEIHLFNNDLLHTKSILIDDRLVLVGTVNMDVRSFTLNLEVTTIVEDPSFANEISQLHCQYLQKTESLNLKQWQKRPFYHRILEHFFFFFSPLL
ncbi:cardiolipin synthase [Mergibacter septicus]|uniref:cardiolipin synthase n=1 Tax=Mergibacter septicus TaxID=221402 RepID=UPI001179788C|nr:cardiolipin synthase [Mergibacter septicus]AWX13491.1 cardiolipin synthase [Mergibacter septicus]